MSRRRNFDVVRQNFASARKKPRVSPRSVFRRPTEQDIEQRQRLEHVLQEEDRTEGERLLADDFDDTVFSLQSEDLEATCYEAPMRRLTEFSLHDKHFSIVIKSKHFHDRDAIEKESFIKSFEEILAKVVEKLKEDYKSELESMGGDHSQAERSGHGGLLYLCFLSSDMEQLGINSGRLSIDETSKNIAEHMLYRMSR